MANIAYKLSSKVGSDGKSQLIILLTINPRTRPCFKTGIFVKKQYFKPIKVTKKGNIMGIVPPKKGNMDYYKNQDVEEARIALEALSARLLKLCQVAPSMIPKERLSKEWLEKYLDISKSIATENITKNSLLEEEKRHEEEQQINSIPSIKELGELYLSKKKCSIDTLRTLKVLFRTLMRYELFVQKTTDPSFAINVATTTVDDIKDFDYYYQNEYRYQEKYPELYEELLQTCPIECSEKHKSPRISKRSRNTIVKTLGRLRAFYKWLNLEDITQNQPFANFKIGKESYDKPICITTEERDIIANTDLSNNPSLAVQRDIFIFQSLTGCRVSDLLCLTTSNINNDMLTYIPIKTMHLINPPTARIPLTERAKAILDRYKEVVAKGELLPLLSKDKYNDAIKKVFIACGITRTVQKRNPKTDEMETVPIYTIAGSHLARRTFINELHESGIAPDIIGEMSGHTPNSTAIRRYYKTTDEHLRKAVKNIDIKGSKDNTITTELENLLEKLDIDVQKAILQQIKEKIMKGSH